MNTQPSLLAEQQPRTRHRIFATLWERFISRAAAPTLDPARREVIQQARGVVLEVGAGNGLNFALYDPQRVERVEAVELDDYMLRYARQRVASASVPITLTQASVEALPFADATFASAVATLVFCSVGDPERGLREVWRVLEPGGTLALFEHIRSEHPLAATVQDALTPVWQRWAGNCHPNRATVATVRKAGFVLESVHVVRGGIEPQVVVIAKRP